MQRHSQVHKYLDGAPICVIWPPHRPHPHLHDGTDASDTLLSNNHLNTTWFRWDNNGKFFVSRLGHWNNSILDFSTTATSSKGIIMRRLQLGDFAMPLCASFSMKSINCIAIWIWNWALKPIFSHSVRQLISRRTPASNRSHNNVSFRRESPGRVFSRIKFQEVN